MATAFIKKVGIIGSGDVAKALSKGFVKYGYSVQIASRDPTKLADFIEEQANDKLTAGTFSDAAANADLVVLAVAGPVAESALDLCGIDNLKNKIIIDTCNPIAAGGAAEDGVLVCDYGCKDSLMEVLQAKVPEAKFVKAFSCVGNAHMVDPNLESTPTMFICGNDNEAKQTVTGILKQFGWDVMDMGGVKSARAIEPLVQLWCLPLFLGTGKGDYALKMVYTKK